MYRYLAAIFSSCLGLASGCSGAPPGMAQGGVGKKPAQTAISECDSNGDGAIAGDELRICPSLSSAHSKVDSDADGRVTASEIQARVIAWAHSKVAVIPVFVVVRFAGRPLEGAEVTFSPDK